MEEYATAQHEVEYYILFQFIFLFQNRSKGGLEIILNDYVSMCHRSCAKLANRKVAEEPRK